MEYKVVFINDKTNYIAANHRKNELLISNDIQVSRTENGKLRATFQNSPQQKQTFSNFVHDLFCGSKSQDYSDCSIIIEEPSTFHYCTRKDGEYQLFGGGVTFNGTSHDDKLTMYECQNSTINLGDGNNTVNIAGAPKGGYLADFQNNTIKTGKGKDTVTVSGNFNKFTNNRFFLGKGSDIFRAEVNPENDENIISASSYDKNKNTYMKNVSGSTIQATDGKKGLFEKDIFEAKTYSANNFIISGFEPKNVKVKATPTKPLPVTFKQEIPKTEQKNSIEIPTKKEEIVKSNEKLSKEDLEKKIRLGNLIYLTTGKPEGLENAYKKVENWLVK